MDADRDLIIRCLQQEVKAQNQFYRQFAPVMFGICMRYAKNQMEAEDILQEGFVRVFRNLHSFRFEGSLEGWVRRIVIHTAINFLKSNAKYTVEVDLDNAGIHATLHNEILSKLTVEEMLSIIRELPTGYRTVFNLHVIDCMTHKEIGTMLGISEDTSKTQFHRAQLKIRAILKAKNDYGLKETIRE